MSGKKNYDFCGYATKNNLVCGDGRVIKQNAFSECDGTTVPLVWNHLHDGPDNILGHALLENRKDGVYAYATFNDTNSGKTAKELVAHGDVRALSIYANKLQQDGSDVVHGVIRELSLVLAGANPGAFIDEVMAHDADGDSGMIIGYDENITIHHAEEPEKKEEESKEEPEKKEEVEKDPTKIIESMTEDQKNLFYNTVALALETDPNEAEDVLDTKEDDKKNEKKEDEGEDSSMKHNVFDNDSSNKKNVLSHSDWDAIIKDGKRHGSLKESYLAHTDGIEVTEDDNTYGIQGIDFLFPDAKSVTNEPMFISRRMDWVDDVMKAVGRTPFSRIKSLYADITADEARAKGYVKGKAKVEEVFALLKRTTSPQTIYKKQKLDRDDIIDITDFDVVKWIKAEMRVMLDEEIARAILIGDGRPDSSDDKISQDHVRSIWNDNPLFSINKTITVAEMEDEDDTTEMATKFIDGVIRARKAYKGSGNPTCYATSEIVTACLLLKDGIGRYMYKTVEELATTLRVSKIVEVEAMSNKTRTNSDNDTATLLGIIVNLSDYKVGADKGGEVNLFDDFDIDYNANKYLIETRCSGALIKPYSAIVVEMVEAESSESSESAGSEETDGE